MSIQLITGFLVNTSQPLDNRIVASGSTNRNNIPYKYEGLRVFDTLNNRGYYWDGASFNPEITDQVSGTAGYIPQFTSQYYVGNSNIYQSGSSIGLGTNNPMGGNYTYLQIGGTSLTEDPNWYSLQSEPLTIHRGGSLTIGYNYYYSTVDNYFKQTKGSTWLSFEGDSGDLSFNNRTAPLSFAAGKKQVMYVSNLGRIGIGGNFTSFTPPGESLDVVGNAKISGTVFASYVQLSTTTPGQNYGLILHDNTALNPAIFPSLVPTAPFAQGTFIDWSSNVPIGFPVSTTRSYWAGISGYSRGSSGGDLILYTNNTYTANPGDATRPKRLIIKNTGEIAIGEDPTMSTANGPQVISSTVGNLFGNVKPKFEIITDSNLPTGNSGTYRELMVLRHPSQDSSAVLRRLGYIAKLSIEGVGETDKSGGFIVESTSANAANPSLSLVLGVNKHLSIDYDGSIYFPGASGAISTINSSNSLFANTKPKFEVNTGSSTGSYNELMVLRHSPNDSTAVTRRLGYLMSLSNETTQIESVKSGGVILESTLANALSPSLHLVVNDQKTLTLDNNGDVTLPLGNIQFKSTLGNYISHIMGTDNDSSSITNGSSFPLVYNQTFTIASGLSSCTVMVEVMVTSRGLINFPSNRAYGSRNSKIIRCIQFTATGTAILDTATYVHDQIMGSTSPATFGTPVINAALGQITVSFDLTLNGGDSAGPWIRSVSYNLQISKT